MSTKIISLVLLTTLVARLAYAAAGDLFPSFGTNGVALSNFSTVKASGIAIQPDGKIVVVGTDGSDLIVARYKGNGQPDPSFNQGMGFAVMTIASLGGDADDRIEVGGVAFQKGGPFGDAIVVAGTKLSCNVASSCKGDLLLARYRLDGSLERYVVNDLGADERLNAVKVLKDGRILVVGKRDNGSDSDFLVARYDADLNLDSSFNRNGWIHTDFGDQEEAAALAISEEEQRIVVGGTSGIDPHQKFALAVYSADGRLDRSFDGDGLLTIDLVDKTYGKAVGILPDGRVIIAGLVVDRNSNSEFAIASRNADGSPDASFGGLGMARLTLQITNETVISGLEVMPDGSLIVAGYNLDRHTGWSDFALAKVLTSGSDNGRLDPSFGTRGYTTTDVGGVDFAVGLVRDPNDDSVIVAGTSLRSSTSEFALARYQTKTAESLTVVAMPLAPQTFVTQLHPPAGSATAPAPVPVPVPPPATPTPPAGGGALLSTPVTVTPGPATPSVPESPLGEAPAIHGKVEALAPSAGGSVAAQAPTGGCSLVR